MSLSLSKVCSMHYFEDLQVGSVEAETIRVRRRRCLSLPTAFAAEGHDRVKFAFRDYDSFSSSTKLHVNFIDTNGKRNEAVSKSATDSCRREK